jgi:hydroxyacylglutathione hydrolase
MNLERNEPHLYKMKAILGVGLCSNIYIIGDKEITLIDTGVGNRSNRLKPVFDKLGFRLEDIKEVVLTHTHFDHIGGLVEILDGAEPLVMIHENGVKELEESYRCRISTLKDRDLVETDEGLLSVVYTPGHTSSSICLYDKERKIMFSGDTVFPDGGFGRTDLPTGDSNKIIESLRRLSTLRIDVLLPGHGKPVLEKGDDDIKKALILAKDYSPRP